MPLLTHSTAQQLLESTNKRVLTIEGALAPDRAAAMPGDVVRHPVIVWTPGRPVEATDLETLRGLLTEHGRVVLRIQRHQSREVLPALSEAGFLIRQIADEDTASATPLLPEWTAADSTAADSASADSTSVDPAATESHRLILAQRTETVVRSIKDEDLEELLILFQRCFQRSRTSDHWRWKYDSQETRRRQISIARDPEGRLAAHYAGYPVRFRDARNGMNRVHEALHIADIMSAPEARSMGFGPSGALARCVIHFYARFCTDRIGFNYGVNTGSSRGFTRRFAQVETVDQITVWQRVAYHWVARGSRSYSVRAVSGPGLEFDRFFEGQARHYGVLVERSGSWLQWRYLDCPDQPAFYIYTARRWGRLVGWSVFRRQGENLAWCDALIDPRFADCARALVTAALEAQSTPVETISAWFPQRPNWWAEELRNLGFEPSDEPNDLRIGVVSHQTPNLETLLQDLYYAMGDFDLV